MEEQTQDQSTGVLPALESNSIYRGRPIDFGSRQPRKAKIDPEKVLFVGGPKDGKREFWPSQNVPIYRSVVFDRRWDNVQADACRLPIKEAMIGVTEHTYQLKRFTGENGAVYQCAFHSSVNNDPMAALIKGYRYYRKKRYER